MTQKEKVKEIIKWRQMSIKEISEYLEIKEPNVRRILGTWVKTWEINRITRGIYTIETSKWSKAFIKVCDSLQEIKNLKNIKFDMVFLDIPYKTQAVIWGSRGVKYPLISPIQFKEFLEDLKPLLVSEDTPVYYMYSNAPSGKKQIWEEILCHRRE